MSIPSRDVFLRCPVGVVIKPASHHVFGMIMRNHQVHAKSFARSVKVNVCAHHYHWICRFVLVYAKTHSRFLSDGQHFLSAIGESKISLSLGFEKAGAVTGYAAWFFVVHGLRGASVVVVDDVMMVCLTVCQ